MKEVTLPRSLGRAVPQQEESWAANPLPLRAAITSTLCELLT